MLQVLKNNNQILKSTKVHRRKTEGIDAWLSEDSTEYKEVIDYLNSPKMVKELKKVQKGNFLDMKTFLSSVKEKNS